MLLLVVGVFSHLPHLNRQQVSAKIGSHASHSAQTKIMYGSTIRIKATGSNYQYTSHYSASIATKLSIPGAVATSPSLAWSTTTTTTHFGPFEKPTMSKSGPTVLFDAN